MKDVLDINLSTKVNMVGTNPRKWWINIGATRHLCSDKEICISFQFIRNCEKLYTKNSTTFEIESLGKMILKMTSRKEISLNNVLHMLEIHKNLESRSLCNKHGFLMVFKSEKIILSKIEMHTGEYVHKMNN